MATKLLACGTPISPDSKRIVTTNSQGVRLWDTQTGECLKSFEGP
ncbi:hypothetical protein [Neochlamydia sp. AcF95]|nr:hypothetical protein [Neochlamydia sp. AcF95]MBS4166702.1 hypothetical protein [Neochlamydia sp. AcF65]MBS4171508.1 hypothetical protein [Neochlamydia sp. AcF95]